ncbi:MAG: hypothetical protein N2746_02595 [Deltaproteobacteria bacterium]|nr:hypothetical protein [Deltaproteobacteria bacterium]
MLKKAIYLSPLMIILLMISACDCGGEPDLILDDIPTTTDTVIDVTTDILQDISSKDIVHDILDTTTDDILHDTESMTDISQDISLEDGGDIKTIDVPTEVSDISEDFKDVNTDVTVDTEFDIAQPDIVSDVMEDTTIKDASADDILDGGMAETVIKNCPVSPNNLSSLIFEFSNPRASSFECNLNGSDWVPCSSPYQLPNNDITAIPEGDNIFSVRAIIDGNPENTSVQCRWIKDTIPPDTIFSSQPDFECKNFVSIEVEATEERCTFEYSLDGSAWIESLVPIEVTNLSDGNHSILIRSKDEAGNIDNTPLEYNFETDTTPPDLIILSKPNDFINTSVATFTFTSTDSNAIFMCSIDWGNFYECLSPQIINNLSEQSHIFKIYSKDKCGNKSKAFEHIFTVDTTEPESIITSKPSPKSNDPNPSFSFTCSEDSIIECKLDNDSFSTCISPVRYNMLSDGQHTFSVRCIDRAGNMDKTPAMYNWIIDTISPETTITSKPNNLSQFKNATFEFICSEAGTAECSLDNTPYSSCTSPKTYTNLPDGNHHFSVRCIDEANNIDLTPATHSWSIDTTPPITTITEAPQSYTKNTTATFRFSCNENGLFECRLDAQNWTPCISPKVYINLSNGAHLFSVRCIDNVGNVETSPPVYYWTVDTISPDTYILSHPPSVSKSTSANFAFGSNESEVTFECSLNDGSYTSCQANQQFNNLLEGTNKVCVRASDRAGNTDLTPACYQWLIDTTPPDTFITSNPPILTNQTSATFTFDSNESGTTFECSLDGSPFTTCSSPKMYSGLLHGVHIFSVRSMDVAGNYDVSPATYMWEVDIEAPKSSISNYPQNPSNSPNASFSFYSNDPNATFECSLNGEPFSTCTSPKTYFSLYEGTHNFRVRAKDNLGNIEQNPPSYTWNIDLTPPDTTITSYPPNPTNNPSPLFSFISSEAGSTFECSHDLGAFFSCSSPHVWNGIREGVRYFSVRAIDKAGNIDQTPAQYSFNVDLTNPETFIINKPTNPTKQTTATFTFYSNESDAIFECKIDNNSYTPCTSPMIYNSLSNGIHTFYVRAIDLAGNIDTTPAEYEWKVDTVPPDTIILTYPSSITNSKNAQFTFSCNDETLPCTFECSLNSSTFSLCTSPVVYTNLPDGNHTFRVRALDAAQNLDPTPAQYNWRVDTIPPQAFINSMPGNPSMSTDATFSFHCNEVATTECSLDGSGYTPCTSPKTYTNLSIGTHTFSLRCIDQANNISLPVQYSWDIMLFRIERVDAPRFFTNFYNRSIKTDSNNIPHIVYGGDNLYHAYLSGANFITEVIDNSPGVGEYASLFIDKNDYIHISYYNPTNLSLMYATNSGGVWSKSTVDSGNNVGMYSAIAVDNNGFVHIAYFDATTSDLKYATNSSGVWTTQVVESQFTSGEYCSIHLDSSNNPHIAYYKRGFTPNKGVLRYARRSGNIWNIQTLDDQGDGIYVGLFTSIFIDKTDNIHISYFDSSSSDLKYVNNLGGVWNPPTVIESSGDVGRFSSLVVDDNGVVHVTYYNNSNATLRYANNLGGSFNTYLVDNSASVGTFNSLAIDKNGVLHASYYDATNAKVKYAMRLQNTWTNFRFVDAAGSVGQYPSIHLDTLKRPHICYYDAYFGGELKYAYKLNNTWHISTIDNGGVSNYNVGRFCNLKTDSLNKVHISYLDISRGNLKYINNTSGNWIAENPDNINTVGQYQTSLAIDSNGKIHISYHDTSNGGDLKYTNNINGFWLSTVVDDGGVTNANVGRDSSIAVDKNGFIHISYYDATNADLKYATNISGSFVTYTIDSTGNVGQYTAIALDANGYPVISYYDGAPNNNLKVAIFDGVNWSTTVADSHVNNVGLYTSISIDANNKIHIAYYDATIYRIKYATNKYGSWQNFIIDTEGRLGTNGFTTGIFATPSGMVHIVYYDFLMRDLKYATNEN